jgi:hypothetical protein
MILRSNQGCELSGGHRPRHLVIGEYHVYRSTGRQILPSVPWRHGCLLAPFS